MRMVLYFEIISLKFTEPFRQIKGTVLMPGNDFGPSISNLDTENTFFNLQRKRKGFPNDNLMKHDLLFYYHLFIEPTQRGLYLSSFWAGVKINYSFPAICCLSGAQYLHICGTDINRSGPYFHVGNGISNANQNVWYRHAVTVAASRHPSAAATAATAYAPPLIHESNEAM